VRSVRVAWMVGCLLTSTLVGCADPELDPKVPPAPICLEMVSCWYPENEPNAFVGLDPLRYGSLASEETAKNVRSAFGPTGTCWTDAIGAYRCGERCLEAARQWCGDAELRHCDGEGEACSLQVAIDARRAQTDDLRDAMLAATGEGEGEGEGE
jgi:hypothetical protein